MSVSDNHRPRVVLASRKSSAMSNLKPTTGLVEFAGTAPAVGEAKAVSASRDALFVIPRGRGDGFRASIRGHLLELADPNSAHGLAPTPDDLLIVSIASDFAWFARGFLRACGIEDYVSVSAGWRTRENAPRLENLEVTVTVAKAAEEMSEALVAALEDRVAARSLHALLPIRVRAE